jgi:hypothetical protein
MLVGVVVLYLQGQTLELVGQVEVVRVLLHLGMQGVQI